MEKIAKRRNEREDYIENILNVLREKLNEISVQGHLDGRPKAFLQYIQENGKSE